MAYNNKIPNIGSTSSSVRDVDFISITEVKAFNELIDEIVKKLSVISNENSNITDINSAINIAQELKKIEFNMADAINSDGTLNISSTPDSITGETGGPVYGSYSMYDMLTKLDDLNNRFTKLVGEHTTEWKIPLDTYYNETFSNFKNKITSIFSNSINSQLMEEKVVENDDYTKRPAVKLETNQTMRLNPDTAAYPRNVSIVLSEANVDYIAFEVTELETNNLVFHLNFFNGNNYYRFNVIIDNGEVFIVKEESFKFVDNTYTIKIWKYTENNVNKYIVTLASNIVDNSEYSFEIEGLLVGNYDFSNTGFALTDHPHYFEYELVDKSVTEVPTYNETYYWKEQITTDNTGSTVTSDGYTYVTVTDSDKAEGIKAYESYYTKVDGEYTKVNISSFDENTVYYTKVEYNWKSVTNLRSWDEKEYYIRKTDFDTVGTINISKDTDSGTVNIDNTTVDGKDIVADKYPVVIKNKKYTKPLYYTHIDIDCANIFENVNIRDQFLRNNDFYYGDTGVSFHHSDKSTLITHDRPRNIDGKETIALGSKLINVTKLKPNRYIKTGWFDDANWSTIEGDTIHLIKELTPSDCEYEGLEFLFTHNYSGTVKFEQKLGLFLTNYFGTYADKVFVYSINDIIYALPSYDYSNGDYDYYTSDISALKLVEENGSKIWKSATNCDILHYNHYILKEIGGEPKLVLNSEYLKKYKNYNDKSDEQFILSLNKENGLFEIDKSFRDIFNDTVYVNKINKIEIQKHDVDNLIRFNVYKDKNNENNDDGEGFIVNRDVDVIVYNVGTEDVLVPESIGHKEFLPGSEFTGISFVSCASNDRKRSVVVDQNGKLWYSDDGLSYKLDDRINIIINGKNKILNDTTLFKEIYCDSENRWFGKIIDDSKYFLVTSVNGYNWEKVTLTSDDSDIYETDDFKFFNLATNRYFLMTNSSTIPLISEDGLSWEQISILPAGIWRDIAWNTKKYVIVGDNGAYQSLENDLLSVISSSFIKCTGADGDWSNVVTYNEKEFVISGSSGIRYSDKNNGEETTAINFTQKTTMLEIEAGNRELVNNRLYFGIRKADGVQGCGGFIDQTNNVCFGSNEVNNEFCHSVAYSSSLKIYVSSFSSSGLYYSYDSRHWLQSNITTGAAHFYGDSTYWCEDLSLFIAGNGVGLFYSTDGKNWTASNITSGFIPRSNIIKFGDNYWLGSNGGNLYYTSDGKSWTKSTITSSGIMNRIATNGSVMVVAGGKDLYYNTISSVTFENSNLFDNSTEYSFTSVIYDSTLNKFFATSSTRKELWSSTDGKTWSVVYTASYNLGWVASNGKVVIICQLSNADTVGGVPLYSIDGGKTFSNCNYPLDYPEDGFDALFYIQEWDRFYAYSRGLQDNAETATTAVLYSNNGIDWNTLMIPCESVDSYVSGSTNVHAISCRAEDPTTQDVIGYYFVWKEGSNILLKSRDGRWWQKITFASEINDISFIGDVGDKDVILTIKDNGIYLSSRNDEIDDEKYSTYGECFKKSSIETGNYGKAITSVHSDINNQAYLVPAIDNETNSIRIDYKKESLVSINKMEPNIISYIGDCGKNVIAVDKRSILQWDKLDNVYHPTVLINKYIESTFIKAIAKDDSTGTIYYGIGTDSSLYIATDTNTKYKIYENLVLNDIKSFIINGVSYVFGLKQSGGIIQLSNITDKTNVDYTSVFSSLDEYIITNIFQKTDGTLILIGNKNDSYTIFSFTIGDDEIISESSTVITLDTVEGSIEFIDLIDDKLIILGHGINTDGSINYYKNFFFDNSTSKIVVSELIDNEKVINFDKIINYKNELFVVNHISNIQISLAKLSFSETGEIVLNTMDSGVQTINDGDIWTIFVVFDKIYFANYSNSTNKRVIYSYKTTDTISGWDIEEITSKSNFIDYVESVLNGEVVTKGSPLNEYTETYDYKYATDYGKIENLSALSHLDFKNDRIYFDKETKGMYLGKYWNNGKFQLKQEMITAVKSEIGNNVNIAVALGTDAKIAIYDKSFDFLKVLDFDYVSDTTSVGVEYVQDIAETDEAVITNIYSGTKEKDNYIFFIVKDKFSTVTHDSYGNFSKSDGVEYSYRLFYVKIDDIKSNIDNDKIRCVWCSNITNPTQIENVNQEFISLGIIKTDPLTINNRNGYQYIIHGIGIKYDNVDSIAYFNVDTSSLVISSPIIYDLKLIHKYKNELDINNGIVSSSVIVCPFDKNNKLNITWIQSNITSGYFYCLTTIGNTVIAGSYSNKGLYYSNDNGITWIQSNITSGDFICLTTIGNTVIAGSYSGKGLYYSNDIKNKWFSEVFSKFTTSGSFYCLTTIGNTVIAGSNNGLYYSNDNGITWIQSNITSGYFYCLITIGNTVIAGSNYNNGLYFYLKFPIILCAINLYIPSLINLNDIDNDVENSRGIFICGTKCNTIDTQEIYELNSGSSLSLGVAGSLGLPKELIYYPDMTSLDIKYLIDNKFNYLANRIVDKYDIPIDTWVKTIGNIILNDIIVPIKAMKIVSQKGIGNNNPNDVIFVIDNDARFNNDSWEKIKDCVTDGNIKGIDTSTNYTIPERISRINLSIISPVEIESKT